MSVIHPTRRAVAGMVAGAMLALGLAGAASGADKPADLAKPFLLHLNGVGGKLLCDRTLIDGLRQGGIDAEVRHYDWTAGEPGLPALQAYDRNHEEAKKVAAILVEQFRADPKRPICITAHSGGAGVAVWALEDLPADVAIDTLVLLAPALSPQYDLSKALRHVTRHAYSFTSSYDVPVLGVGTRLFGTIDGVKGESAGLNGFVKPKGADDEQYRKLIPQPYRTEWYRLYGSMGTHVCGLRLSFARGYIAPLLLTGKPPATQPATAEARR